ncbi:MAG: Sulfatase protein, partial [Candidatus Hydrogenedentes bacterium]|nr:Sulfatase protein [Candidatus Hydrogenedentota bacterium]
IHADQHRIDCLGCYGNKDVRTPHIDALAANGVRFENSFCPYPVCTPSRYSLISGQYVHEHRGWSNHCTLPPGTETFPGILRKAGYRTKAVGKMHFTPTYLDVGFDELALAEQNGPGRWDDDYHRALRDAGLVDYNDLEDQEREYRKDARPEYWQTFGAMPSNLPDEYHSTQWIGDRAAETIAQWGPSGNLLMAGFIKPHHPFDPAPSNSGLYDPESLTVLPGWTTECLPRDEELSKGYFPNADLTEASMRRVMAYYYATIEEIDRQVGRMVALLKEKGLYDNTLIVYTADHGDYMGFHHMILKGNHMYDPLMKVPLILKYPGGRQAGTVSAALVNNIDLAPTIVRQTGLEPASTMHGLDLATDPVRDIVFAESREGEHAMARSKTRKLILWPAKNTGYFFDLEKDPLEMDNRFDDPVCQDEVKAFTKAILDWRAFDTLPKVYVDENAPVIGQPNVPSRKDGHREAIYGYFQEKMRKPPAGA